MKPKSAAANDPADQVLRFKKVAKELGSDETPGALDRAFTSLDVKKKELRKPVKRKAKAKWREC